MKIKATKEEIAKAKEMIAKLEKKESVPVTEFLPLYNKITGRNEKSNCPGCWLPRYKLMKAMLQELEDSSDDAPKAEQKAPRKKAGRPRKKDTDEKQ